MIIMEEAQLPEKLSDLLEVALKDLGLCEEDSELYIVDMGIWHERPTHKSKCYVCLAGSVMAKTLGADAMDMRHRAPGSYKLHNALRLQALENLRIGDVNGALRRIGNVCPEHLCDGIPVSEYEDGSRAFKTGMQKILDLLREEGL